MTTKIVTGAAGFIGSHLVEALLKQGHQIIGIRGKGLNLPFSLSPPSPYPFPRLKNK